MALEVPWFGRLPVNCATFEDDVLFCQVMFQMCSRCVPVHPDALVSYWHYYMLSIVLLLCGRCVYI